MLPLQGLTTAGWKLRFDAEQSEEDKGNDAARKRDDYLFSLGFSSTQDGAAVTNLVPGSPADLAGLSPDARLVAVDGRKYSKYVLLDALKSGGDESRNIQVARAKG